VIIAKRLKTPIFGVLRQYLGVVFHELASYNESKIVEGHLTGDHEHYMHQRSAKVLSIEWSRVHQGESSIQIARKFGARQKNFTGEHFWAEYFVPIVGLEENVVQAYIRN
jgi:putative transposase